MSARFDKVRELSYAVWEGKDELLDRCDELLHVMYLAVGLCLAAVMERMGWWWVWETGLVLWAAAFAVWWWTRRRLSELQEVNLELGREWDRLEAQEKGEDEQDNDHNRREG